MTLNGGFGGASIFDRMLESNRIIPPAIDAFVHDLVRAHAEQDPDLQAICASDGNLTYGELEDLSSQLATRLVTQGVGPEVTVPLCFEKSKWAIVGLLGTLKAGGAFALLDPSQPVARLEYFVKQAGATFVLSSSACLGTCQNLVERSIVVDAEAFLNPKKASVHSSAKLNNAAYIIFTSGSTGVPKAVIIEHSQLSTMATYCGQRMGYGKKSRVFQFASYAFDACITDIFATLVHGGTVCIPSEWERNNAIVDAMNRMEVTNAKFTPSLATNLTFENVPTLKTLILGGESASPSFIEKWASKLRLILVYGPTECCVICFTSDASDHQTAPGEIGRPVSSRAWISKQGNWNELAEIGEVGELLIEGPLVGRGYLNDQSKTDEKFIRNPDWTSHINGSTAHKPIRLYRTGDLAKYLEDGRVCYMGRIDNQVKIRGVRLELEEVEKNLRRCLSELEDVETKHVLVEAVILSGLVTKQLVAFLCLTTSAPIGCLDWDRNNEDDGPSLRTSPQEQEAFSSLISRIESKLRLLLPTYAVPSIWIPVRHVPLTVSRKLDRKLLRDGIAPLPAKQLAIFTHASSRYSGLKSLPDLTENESHFRRLWADVFCVPPSDIDLDDNFFSLGGDSVLAIKLVAAARAGGLDLSLEAIFDHPILSDMANITKGLTRGEETPVDIAPFSLLDRSWDINLVLQEARKRCSIAPHNIRDIYPVTPMQEGLLALSMKDDGTYILQFVYQMPETIDLDKLRKAWENISKRTEVLQTRFFDYNSVLLQVVVDEPLNWDVIDGDLASFLTAEKQRGLLLENTMSRLSAVRQDDPRQYFLVWTIHHALVDGWSESDIITSVEQEYLGITPAIPTNPKFNTFVKHIMKQDKTSAKELWKEQLTGASAPVFPPLPDPNYIPKVQRSNRILHHLDSHADAELEHKVVSIKRGSTTAATMIQAAWFLLLASYSNSTDIITGVTLNGRTAQLPGIDRIPGPTVTTIPFRARFTPDRRVQDFLQIIQKQYLKILPFAQFGLDNIRRASEDAVAACKFRSLLVVQSAHRAPDSKKILQGRSYSFPVMDFAIVMECELHKDNNIDFRATFDNQVLSEAQVRKMFQQMEQLLLRISVCGPSTTVAELQKELQTDVMMTHQADGTAHSSAPPKKCYKPPLTDMEKRISGIWKTLLGVDQVGLDDNFFELGGGSVLAMRLVSMARRGGMTMTVAGIFKTPNLRQLALTVRENARVDEITPFSLLSGPSKAKLCNQATQQCRVSLEEIEDMYPISAMQLHYVTGYPEAEKDINGPWDWQSQAVYSLPHAIDFEKFKGIWISAIHRHQSLRTRVVNTGHGIFQVVLKEPEPFRWAEADDLDRCAEEDKTAPMTFGDRLLRLALVAPKDSDERFFVMTAHHMIYDAFARSMLFKELEAAYFQDLPDTPLPTMNQFVKYITEADKQSATDFWTSHLADANTKPLFLIPPGRIVFSIAEKSMTIDIPEIQRADCTLPTMVEISCSLTIARHLDCEDVILYSDRSGRNLPVEGIQDLIGPTTLFIPVRTHINPNQKVKDLLRESQQFNSTSIPFEHLGWLELREMSHLKDRLKDSLNININPHPLASLGKGWGLEYVSSHAGCDDPFGVNVDLYDGRMEWVVYYDERFVGGDVVERLLREMKRVFLTLVDAGLRPEMTVGGVLTSLAMM